MFGLSPWELFFIVFLGPLWLWALVDCARTATLQGNERLIWILVILVLGPVGGVVYLVTRWTQHIRARRAVRTSHEL